MSSWGYDVSVRRSVYDSRDILRMDIGFGIEVILRAPRVLM